MKLQSRWLAGLITATTSLSAGESRAASITFNFEGYLDTLVDIGLDDSVALGTPFSGSYTFDPVGVSDSSPQNPTFGSYGFVAPSHLSVRLGNYEFATNDLLHVAGNDSGGDLYYIRSWSPFYSDGFEWRDMGIFLQDNTGTALDSDALLLTPPDLHSFQSYAKFAAAVPEHPGSVITGRLTSITPEPGSLITLAVGAGLLLARRRRIWHRAPLPDKRENDETTISMAGRLPACNHNFWIG